MKLVKEISLDYLLKRGIYTEMENLNPIQTKILSKLLFNPKARFEDLNTDFLTTDHFSYHIKNLLQEGLIKKDGTAYALSAKGKMLAGKIDTATHTMEKQPKVSVILIPHKKFDTTEKFLVQERTKEPYFGYLGFITGKVRFGEILQETAARELKEETGLEGKFKFCYEIHEMTYDKIT
ncbi:MAG TPA: NUDIX domain-containing protein, partial [Candidatus Saccharimonadales bacterium]|nr:NUDIX domain-containing protein [Candidatus Saccharimonadales bacterium]